MGEGEKHVIKKHRLLVLECAVGCEGHRHKFLMDGTGGILYLQPAWYPNSGVEAYKHLGVSIVGFQIQ